MMGVNFRLDSVYLKFNNDGMDVNFTLNSVYLKFDNDEVN